VPEKDLISTVLDVSNRWAAPIRAFASVVALIVAAVAVWIAHLARNAQEEQAKAANEALKSASRQTEISAQGAACAATRSGGHGAA
jgi:cytoskeletal protein RodZ